MLTTCPCFALRKSGMQARVIHIRPRTLTSHIPIQSSSTAFSIGANPSAPPALLTSTSMRPNFAETSRTNASTLFLSVTSSAIATPSSPATRLRRSTRRAPTTIWKPRRPSATAVAAPMPDEAPVMTATGVDLRRSPDSHKKTPAMPSKRNLGKMLEVLVGRSEEHTSELQSPCNLVCRLLLEKKKKIIITHLLFNTKQKRKPY